jgi:hypothetical protein
MLDRSLALGVFILGAGVGALLTHLHCVALIARVREGMVRELQGALFPKRRNDSSREDFDDGGPEPSFPAALGGQSASSPSVLAVRAHWAYQELLSQEEADSIQLTAESEALRNVIPLLQGDIDGDYRVPSAFPDKHRLRIVRGSLN